MGGSSSKPARAAGAAARKFPSRPAAAASAPKPTNAAPQRPPPAPQHRAGPTVKPQARASGDRDEDTKRHTQTEQAELTPSAINLDASDPDFARSLRSIGPVQPNPTLSPSSAFTPHPSSPSNSGRAAQPLNPALRVLQARAQLADEADQEFMDAGRRGHPGRRFLDVGTLRQVLMLRDDRGLAYEKIEGTLGLRKGVVKRLGMKGVVGVEGVYDDRIRSNTSS